MDYFKCENCGKTFNEFKMDFNKASKFGKTLCRKCWKKHKGV